MCQLLITQGKCEQLRVTQGEWCPILITQGKCEQLRVTQKKVSDTHYTKEVWVTQSNTRESVSYSLHKGSVSNTWESVSYSLHNGSVSNSKYTREVWVTQYNYTRESVSYSLHKGIVSNSGQHKGECQLLATQRKCELLGATQGRVSVTCYTKEVWVAQSNTRESVRYSLHRGSVSNSAQRKWEQLRVTQETVSYTHYTLQRKCGTH